MTEWFHTAPPQDVCWFTERRVDGSWAAPVLIHVSGDRFRLRLSWLTDGDVPRDDTGEPLSSAYWYAAPSASPDVAWTPFVIPEVPV